MTKNNSPAPDLLIKQLIAKLWGDQKTNPGTLNPEDWLLAMQTRIEESLLHLWPTGFNNEFRSDVFTTVDHPATLQLQLSPYQTTIGDCIRFQTESRVFGEAKINSKGQALLIAPKLEAGCYPVQCEILSRSKKRIGGTSLPQLRLQVLDNRPVVLIDDLIIKQQPALQDSLSAVASKHKFRWIAVDFSHNAADNIAKQSVGQVSPGPLLRIKDHISKFAQYDTDFKHVFLDLTIRRMRADGAPILAFVPHPEYSNGYKLQRTLEVLDSAKLASNPFLTKLAARAKTFRRRYNTTEPLDWRIQQMTSTKALAGNRCAIEFDNRKARLTVCKHIDSAQKSIDLQTYIFKDGRFVSELSVALVRAARRGVRVRILVDALWSGESFLGLSNAQLRQLASIKNIEVYGIAPANLGDEIGTSKLKQRDHRKILLVDGTTAIVSGRNCGDEYYFDWRETPITDWTNSDDIPWFDAHIEVQGPIVVAIQTTFNEQWQTTTGQSSKKPPRIKPLDDSTARLVVHHGVDDANALASYEAFIHGAQSHLFIVNDFPVVDRIAEALVQAVLRGVRVKILTGCVLARRIDGTFFPGEKHREAFEYVIKSRFGDLINAGIEVYEFTTKALGNIVATGGRVKPYVHAKIATVDGLAVNIGSANLDVSASFWEHEANIVVQNQAFARRTERHLQQLLNRSWKIDLQSEQWVREAAQRGVIAGLWPHQHLS